MRVGKVSAKPARALVHALEGKGWLRRDAIHAVAQAVTVAEHKGKAIGTVRLRAPACGCGRPMAARSNAVTCGKTACRMKHLRRRRRHERKRARIRALFSELFRSRRWRTFTLDEARALGADLRVRARDVDELLRQLVEEDGAAYVVLGAPGVYAFAPPRSRRQAA